jgi:2-C-methyl-D-erythritol 2,4-cyclodiphosphate synthase
MTGGGAGRSSVRVGQGFDVHPFSDQAGRALVLGGVVIADSPGLAGHSDADVLSHAVADAVLGAAGLGDIGQHFPDTDPAFAGADSVELLRRVVAAAASAGLVAVNADCTVVCERPRIADYLVEMRARLGDVLDAPVNVKATRAEGLGSLGRAEGIAAFAVVLLVVGDDPVGAGAQG